MTTKFNITDDDLVLAIRSAFFAGNSSPYELKSQEIKQIAESIIENNIIINSHVINYKSPESESRLKSKYKKVFAFCPRCKLEEALVEHRFVDIEGAIFSTLFCVGCGWRGTLNDMLSQRRLDDYLLY